MPRRRSGERMGLNAEINVVSLIDIMMLLMIIFMITAPMMQGGVDVQLPRAAEARPLEAKRGLVVSVNRAGSIFVDRDSLTLDEFRGSFKALADRRAEGGVYLRADQGVPYGTVVRVLAIMRASGVGDVGLVAEPEDVK
jgi:biopolymer transport protein ExbD/biopolymer transport protein TolR